MSNNIVTEFNRFLSLHLSKNNIENPNLFTHTRVGYPGGSFYIKPGEDQQKFLNLYSDVLKYKYRNEKGKDIILNFSEKQGRIGPLMTDYDFEFNNKVVDYEKNKDNEDFLKHRYNEDDIIIIIKYINNLIFEYFDIDEKEINAYVLEKNSATLKFDKNKNFKYIKDGFHICYILPFTTEQRYLIYNKLKSYFEDGDKLKHIKFTNSYDSVFDESTISRNNWMMYGSCKTIDDNHYYYSCKYYYDYKCNKFHVLDDRYDLVIYFSVQQYIDCDDDEALKIKDKYIEILENNNSLMNSNKNKSNILNQNKQFDQQNIIPTKQEKDLTDIYFKLNSQTHEKFYFTNTDINPINIDEARQYLELLDKDRCEDYNKWIEICWILKSIGNNKDLYDLFVEFSKSSTKFSEDACLKYWNRARTEGNLKTINSLRYYARLDNQDKFKQLSFIINEKLINYIIDEQTDADIAKYIYSIYKGRIVCTDVKNETWYIYNKHKWTRSDNNVVMFNLIINEVVDDFNLILDKKYKLLSKDKPIQPMINIIDEDKNFNLDDDVENIQINNKIESLHCNAAIKEYNENMKNYRDKVNKKIAIYKKLKSKLKNNTPVKNIISTCKMVFYVENFEENLDLNPYLIGFNNGIYDLSNKKFRNGIPEDYVSFSVGYDYTDDYNLNDEIFTKINKYFDDLFPISEVKDYVLRYLASRLEGHNINNQFNIWSGSACNGKSVFTSLLEKIYGDYYHVLEHTVITQKRACSSAASPEIANTKGKRIITIQEPGANDNLKVEFIKQLSGGQDKITTRHLYSKPISFVPQFELILICNQIPLIDNNDQGISRRLSVVNFITKFVQKQPKKDSNERRGNPNIIRIIKNNEWTAPIMWLLINKYYKEYLEVGLQKPTTVEYSTNKYINDSDEIKSYILDNYVLLTEENYEKNNKDYNKIKFSDLYEDYTKWSKSHFTSGKSKSKQKFKEHLIDNINLSVDNKDYMVGLYVKNSEVDTIS